MLGSGIWLSCSHAKADLDLWAADANISGERERGSRREVLKASFFFKSRCQSETKEQMDSFHFSLVGLIVQR